jgi:iron complex transport system ATP-binding protein
MIKLENVCVSYGKRQVLHAVSAAFERGRVTAIIGANGCGKTTLLKTALGILPAFEGDVTVDGNALSAMSTHERAKKMAYLAQSRSLPRMTVEQLVLHGRYAHLAFPHVYSTHDKRTADAAIGRMGLTDVADRMLSELSGGMRQNAYIAMALSQSSDYILLDEPTTYLDIANRLQLMRTLRELAEEGKGVVVVLHDLILALKYADEIAVMREGRVVLQAEPQEVFTSGALRDVFGVEIRSIADGDSMDYYVKE